MLIAIITRISFSALFCFLHCALCFNIEELKPVSYEVEILREPLPKSEDSNLPMVSMMTKYGQQYQCVLPKIEEEDPTQTESKEEKDTDVTELLATMLKKPCLLKGKDWWTYEFCFGDYIKQFHIEDGHVLGQVQTLGIYESDFDWSNETNHEKFKNVNQWYHSQTYVNGTKCDLTGQPRTTEVRFYCEEGASDHIHRVEEPGTCSYVITVHTARLCSHPLLRPPPSKKAHPVPCYPVLTDDQYGRYTQRKEERERLAEQERLNWLNVQQEKLQGMKKDNLQNSEVENTAKLGSFAGIKIDEISSEELNKILTDDEKISAKEKPMKNNPIQDAIEKTAFTTSEIKKLAELEGNVVRAMDRLKSFPEKVQRMRNNIKDLLVLTDGDEIPSLAWMKDALDNDGQKVTNTLKTLLEKLDKAGDEVEEATKTMNRVKTRITDKLDASEKVVQPEDAKTKGDELRLSDLSSDNSDQLTVRIRKLNPRKFDSSGQLYDMDAEQKQKIEDEVKKKLEKAGLDIGGRKIEVKIITGYYDNDGPNEPLTDEESNQFQDMIMSLLFGQKDQLQEMERHQKLEDNYKFSWDESEENEE